MHKKKCTLANPLDRFLSGSVRPAEVMAQRRLRHVWPLGFAPLWAEAFYPESAKLAGSVAAMVVMHVRGTPKMVGFFWAFFQITINKEGGDPFLNKTGIALFL